MLANKNRTCPSGGGISNGSIGSKMVDVVSAASDFCQLETFYANCSRGSAVKRPEVAVVRSALYGRMRIGRCVRRDYGHVGCTSDVRSEVDAMCSGRLGGCRFAVSRLNSRQPCPGDLTPYLQIAYDCVPGTSSSFLCNFRHVASRQCLGTTAFQ